MGNDNAQPLSERFGAICKIQVLLATALAEVDAAIEGIQEFNRNHPAERPIAPDDFAWIMGLKFERSKLEELLHKVTGDIHTGQ